METKATPFLKMMLFVLLLSVNQTVSTDSTYSNDDTESPTAASLVPTIAPNTLAPTIIISNSEMPTFIVHLRKKMKSSKSPKSSKKPKSMKSSKAPKLSKSAKNEKLVLKGSSPAYDATSCSSIKMSSVVVTMIVWLCTASHFRKY
ncbi:predicted protein [Chaetoceros tenuissimus]|uniref:Transmembrane protein n=1 Tax=Chaetoceros tenuissimus TaxID=426638 RepID=A0AAD3H0K7_9STRA|nr:predicted protein [Chaetoceros tenuissimus]